MELLFGDETLSNSFSGSAFLPLVWTLADSFTSWMRLEYSSCFWFNLIVSISYFFRSLDDLKPKPAGPLSWLDDLLLAFEPFFLFLCVVGNCSPESSDIYSKCVFLLFLLFEAEESTELSVVGFLWFYSTLPLTNMLGSWVGERPANVGFCPAAFLLSFYREDFRFEPRALQLPSLILSEADD